jgi:hypothetical protein
MKSIGNLFKLAEKQLIKEKNPFTELDVLEYAVFIRRFLDRNSKRKVRKIMRLTKIERRKNNTIQSMKSYYKKKGLK